VAEATPAKLHVLTLTPFYPSEDNEVSGCFVAEPLQRVCAQGVTCSVIAVNSIYHSAKKSSWQFPAEWLGYFQLPGIFGLSSAGRFLAAALMNKVRHLHSREPVHLIHAHAALPCGHAAMLLSKSMGIPYVVTIHGLDVFNRCFQNGAAARWRKNNSQRVYAGAEKVICVSEKVRQLLTAEDNPPANSDVAYNGTDTEFFTPGGVPEQAPTILMVGNLMASKGHELVLRAVARIRNSHPDLRCTIIGEGADRSRFIALAQDLNIYHRIDFLGRRSRREVAAAMRSCSVFVLPSRYEGLGCVYLEAMACGKPVIACRGQGIDEIVHHGSNGWLIPVDGLEELVEALRSLLANANLRATIGEAARKAIVDTFTLEHQARKLTTIYREVAR
jgi:teichuronic acid biosynthesis glycosyltransferase TuaC